MTTIIIITKTIEVLIRVIGPYFFFRGYVNEGDIIMTKIIIITKTREVLIHVIDSSFWLEFMTRIIIITKTIEVLIRVKGPYFFCRGYVNEGDINI